MAGTCLSEDVVLAFLNGTLDADERGSVEAHLRACATCADVVTWAAAEVSNESGHGVKRGSQQLVGGIAPGTRVDRYVVLSAVGRGAMGEVYAAYHPDLDRRIALKIGHETGADVEERRIRLLREARAIARLSHPNVVAVHDTGTFGDRLYIAMEFVEGQSAADWLRAVPRGWREILRVFTAAGRGLAAAHAAGIVHRDFKPQNVMIGDDGAVRVTDFGLARLLHQDARPAPGRQVADASQSIAVDTLGRLVHDQSNITQTGALVGTPAYMAPEQFRGEPTDARADQFSFCVALWEALYGARPPRPHLRAADAPVESGPSRSRTSGVPALVRTALLRGLSEDREQRYPTMDALLATLDRAPGRRRRRLAGATVAAAVVVVSIATWNLEARRRVSCAVPRERVAAVWAADNPADVHRESIHHAFLAAGGPAAATLWGRFAEFLDEHVKQWSAMYVDACEATHRRGEQSPDLLDLRMSCLNDNLDEVRALIDVLIKGGSSAIPQSNAAMYSLTPVRRCGDVALLRAAVAPPRDAETWQAVQGLRRDLRDAEALFEIGDFARATAAAAALRPKAERTGYEPIIAAVLEQAGRSMIDVRPPAEVDQDLKEALTHAIAARDDFLCARILSTLTFFSGEVVHKYDVGHAWAHLAHAFLQRLGPGADQVRGWLLNDEGNLELYEGELEQGLQMLRESVTIKERTLGRDRPDVAFSDTNVGHALIELQRPAEALQPLQEAVAVLEHCCDGANVLAIAYDLTAEALIALHRFGEAEKLASKALEIARRTPGAFNPLFVDALNNRGDAALGEGQRLQAIGFFSEASRYKSTDLLVARTKFGLARAVWEGGREPVRSVALAREARDLYTANRRPLRARTVTAWLEARGQREGQPRHGFQ